MLSEAKSRPEALAYDKGQEDGRRWGRNAAQPAELEHLQRLFQARSADPACGWEWYFFERDTGRYRRADLLAMDILNLPPEEHDVAAEAEPLWTSAAGAYRGNPNLDNPSYLIGFAAGALEIWNERRNRAE